MANVRDRNSELKTTEGGQAQPAQPAQAQAGTAQPNPEVGKASIGATKSGNRVMLASGESRADYIRRRTAEGAKRGEIAKELGVPYQIVFATTKPKKAAAAAPTEGQTPAQPQ
jgi:hypothetical protein